MKDGRPSSQPTGFSTPPLEISDRAQAEWIRQHKAALKHHIELEESNRKEPVRLNNGDSMGFRDLPQQGAQPSQNARVAQLGVKHSPKQERLNGSKQTVSSRVVPNSENVNLRHRPETIRRLDGKHQYTNVVLSPFSSESIRRLREERDVLQQQNAGQIPEPLIAKFLEERHPPKYPGPPVTFANSRETPIILDANEQQQSREEMIANNRSALALLIENSKRGGRFSPLPQAVQGAQGRTSGPASDPGIKNEFARMFSGIGSGVGSAGPAGSGTNTPLPPPSPTMSHEPQRRTPLANRLDLTAASKPRIILKSRRPRKLRNEESKADLEDG